MGGVFAKNSSLETKLFVSRLVFFANTPPKHEISFGSGNFSSLDWYFSQIPLPNMIYLFIIIYHDITISFKAILIIMANVQCIGRRYHLMLNYDFCKLWRYWLILFNYHPCWSVSRWFVSQRKVRSPEGLPEGDLTFRGETNRWVTLQQG